MTTMSVPLRRRSCSLRTAPHLTGEFVITPGPLCAPPLPILFKPGPLFANVVLADEINRATPRTQSALLEAMSDRQVSVDGQTRPLGSPFMAIATQNPFEFEGTYA